MAKINLPPITTGAYSNVSLNNRFQQIEDALNDGVLWRENPPGEPNEMSNPLDMADNKILNLSDAEFDHEAVNLGQVGQIVRDEVDELIGGLQRTVRAPEDIPALPSAAQRANRLLEFDNDGNPTVAQAGGPNTYPASGITVTPIPTLSSATVQGALAEIAETRIQSVATIADLRALTGLSDGQQVSVKCHTSGLIGGGTYVVTGNGTTDDDGVYVSTSDGKQLQRKTSDHISTHMYGIVTSTSDQSAKFKAAIDAAYQLRLPLIVHDGEYVSDALILESLDGLEIIGFGGANIKHISDTATGASSVKAILRFNSCSNIKVSKINFEGYNTDSIFGDNNAWQGGIIFSASSDCLVADCIARNVQRGFFDISVSHDIEYLRCKTYDTYTGFASQGNSYNITRVRCEAYDSRFSAFNQVTAGQGFLANGASFVKNIDCKSWRAGSDCFRSDGPEGNQFIRCKSYQTGRYAISARNSDNGGDEIIDFYAEEIGDSTFWTGSTDYNSLGSSATGIYLSGVGIQCRNATIVQGVNGQIVSSLDVRDTAADVDLFNIKLIAEPTNSGFVIRGGATNIKAKKLYVDNGDALVACVSATGTDIEIDDVQTYGGGDAIIISSDGAKLTNFTTHNSGYRGLYVLAMANGFIDQGKVINPGSAAGAGTNESYGYRIAGPNVTMGFNMAMDDRGTPEMSGAIRVESTATGFIPGTFVERISSTGKSSALALSGFGSALYGKGATATDTATLLTSLRNAAQIDS